MNRLIALLHPHYVFRDAVTGRFVTKLYALANPSTTVAEKVK